MRKTDVVLYLIWLHGELAPYYSHTGRPSIDPELMMRMLTIGYVFATRSERQHDRRAEGKMIEPWYQPLASAEAVSPRPGPGQHSRASHSARRSPLSRAAMVLPMSGLSSPSHTLRAFR